MVGRPQKTVWHGSDPAGNSVVDGNCDGWNSEGADKWGLGSSLVARYQSGYHHAKLLDRDNANECRNTFVVLCVEITPHSGTMFSRKRRSGGRHDDAMSPQEYEKLIDDIGRRA